MAKLTSILLLIHLLLIEAPPPPSNKYLPVRKEETSNTEVMTSLTGDYKPNSIEFNEINEKYVYPHGVSVHSNGEQLFSEVKSNVEGISNSVHYLRQYLPSDSTAALPSTTFAPFTSESQELSNPLQLAQDNVRYTSSENSISNGIKRKDFRYIPPPTRPAIPSTTFAPFTSESQEFFNPLQLAQDNARYTSSENSITNGIKRKDFRYIPPPTRPSSKSLLSEGQSNDFSYDNHDTTVPSYGVLKEKYLSIGDDNAVDDFFNSIEDDRIEVSTSAPVQRSQSNSILLTQENPYSLSIPSQVEDKIGNSQEYTHTDTVYRNDGYHYERPLIIFEEFQK